MKKYLKVIIICFICILLIGCGKKTNKPDDKNDETSIKLYTDDTKLVLDNNGVYKIVFYHSNDKITKVEHYYEFADKDSAEKEYANYKVKYKSDISIKDIKLEGKYVIFVMDETEYANNTIDEISKKYSYLVPVYEK